MHSQSDQLGRQHLGGERERHHEYGEEHGEEGHPAAAKMLTRRTTVVEFLAPLSSTRPPAGGVCGSRALYHHFHL